MKRVISIHAIVCLISVGFVGAQDYVCGDANYDSVANIDDGAYLFDYLVTGGPAPELPDPAWANWDGHDGLTINDVFACKTFMDSGSYNPVCPVEGPLAPPLNKYIRYKAQIPANADHFIVKLDASNAVKAFLFPLQVFVDNVPQKIDSIDVVPIWDYSYRGAYIYPDSSYCVIGGCFDYSFFYEDLAHIYISLTPSASERTVNLEWADLSPIQSPEPAESFSPMYVGISNIAYEPILEADCCVVPGDANNDGSCDTGDAVFIIAYAFRHTVTPVCFNAADANEDCGVNVGDAVFIMGYVWRGGTRPRCGCAH